VRKLQEIGRLFTKVKINAINYGKPVGAIIEMLLR
jgi:hypothetical protein